MITTKYNNVYINDTFTIAGPDEAKGNIKNNIIYLNDYYYGCKTVEDAEIKMIKTVINNMKRNNKFDLIIGSNLSNQLGTLSCSLSKENISVLTSYSACSSFISSSIIGANLIKSKSIISSLILTNSHTLTSERQFRFPIEYGSLKSNYTTNTITCAIGVILSNIPSNIKVISSTIGRVVDYNIKDVANMGAVMAPAAANTIYEHLKNMNKSIDEYDLVLTGDLGKLGLVLLKSILSDEYGIVTKNILDAGSLIYKESQNKGMGGSGPTCLPFVFFNTLIKDKTFKKILLVGTGALHNTTLVNQKKSIPSISHILEIEVNHDN